MARIPCRLVWMLWLVLSLAGCGALDGVQHALGGLVNSALVSERPMPPAWRSLTVTATTDLNQDSPMALDLVFVSDGALVDALLAMPSGKWFSTRRDLMRSYPDKLAVVSLELVPGQSMDLPGQVLGAQRALAVLAFAHYPGPGDHRQRLLLRAQGYLIELGGSDFSSQEIQSSAPH